MRTQGIEGRKTSFVERLNRRIEEKRVVSDIRDHKVGGPVNDTIFSIF